VSGTDPHLSREMGVGELVEWMEKVANSCPVGGSFSERERKEKVIHAKLLKRSAGL